MTRCRILPVLALSLLALSPVAAAPLRAQSALSLWLGAGRSTADSGFTIKNGHMYAGLQLGLPLIPFALRGEAMLAGSAVSRRAASFIGSVVVPLKLPVLQPYAVAGYGVYGRGVDADKDRGVNYGAGVRIGLSRMGVFGEVRRHRPLDRTLATIGLTF